MGRLPLLRDFALFVPNFREQRVDKSTPFWLQGRGVKCSQLSFVGAHDFCQEQGTRVEDRRAYLEIRTPSIVQSKLDGRRHNRYHTAAHVSSGGRAQRDDFVNPGPYVVPSSLSKRRCPGIFVAPFEPHRLIDSVGPSAAYFIFDNLCGKCLRDLFLGTQSGVSLIEEPVSLIIRRNFLGEADPHPSRPFWR